MSRTRQVPLASIWSLSNGAENRVCHRENISTSSTELLIWSNAYPGVSSTCIKYICKCLFIFLTSMSHCTSCLEKTREVQVFSRSCWHASEFQIKCFFREVWEAWLLPSLVSQLLVRDSFKGPWFSGSVFSTKIFYASYLSNLKQLKIPIYIWKFKSGVDFLMSLFSQNMFFISCLYRRWIVHSHNV